MLTPLQLFPAPLYAFQHVLIQEVAYQSLLAHTRQQLHRQVAEVLTARFPEMVAAQPERIAQHYTEAGLDALAVPYWQRAGERASQRSAYVEAVSHLSKGLELLRTQPDTPARAQSELRLLTRLRLALAVTKGYAAPELAEVHARMRALCQQVEEPTLLLGASRACGRFIWHGQKCTQHTNWRKSPSPWPSACDAQGLRSGHEPQSRRADHSCGVMSCWARLCSFLASFLGLGSTPNSA